MRKRSFRAAVTSLEDRIALAGNLVLADPGVHSYQEGDVVAIQAHASQIVPYPALNVFYALEPGAPPGATINASTGLFLWQPPDVQAIYQIGIRAQDDGDKATGLTTSTDVKTLTVMVFDNPPALNTGVNATISAGETFVRRASFHDRDPDTFIGVVDYGDGSGVMPLTLASDQTFVLSHRYSAPGTYTVIATINDSQGGQGRGRFAVTVTAAKPTPLPSPIPSPTPTPSPTPPPTTNPEQQPTFFVRTSRQLLNLIRNRPKFYKFLIRNNYHIVVQR